MAEPIATRLLHRPALAAAAVILSVGLAVPAPASAQTAASLYEQAQRREATVRDDADATAAALRSAAVAYERIVRRYPRSGYCDNALWQAAGLMIEAFDRSGSSDDRDRAITYLNWLSREYPHSSMRAEARTRAADLVRPAPFPQPSRPAAVRSAAQTAPPPTGETSGADLASLGALEVTGPEAEVRRITQMAIPRGERITIELSREVPWVGNRVDGPDRVFFDLAHSVPIDGLDEQTESIAGDLVRQLRVGRHPDTITRVVLDLADSPRYSVFPLYDPFRLVVDVERRTVGATPTASAAPAVVDAPVAAILPGAPRSTAAPAPVPLPESAALPPPAGPPALMDGGDYSLARQLGLGISRIVIDPGHGGHDPGAQANGVKEADLVLDVALRLRDLLMEQPGMEVVLTRDRDVFIPLEDRTAIARQQHADLFLSIHANASPRPATRGIETYVLNYSVHPEAQAVAARENASSSKSMNELRDLVDQIALNNKLQESRELATMVQTSLVRSLRARSSETRDLGVKEAPFVVLIGAEMPSVLTEISFLTNRAEATLLREDAHRQRIAAALAEAVLKYQSSLKTIASVATNLEAQ